MNRAVHRWWVRKKQDGEKRKLRQETFFNLSDCAGNSEPGGGTKFVECRGFRGLGAPGLKLGQVGRVANRRFDFGRDFPKLGFKNRDKNSCGLFSLPLVDDF